MKDLVLLCKSDAINLHVPDLKMLNNFNSLVTAQFLFQISIGIIPLINKQNPKLKTRCVGVTF